VAIKILERVICQKRLNQIINKYIDEDAVGFTDRMVEELNLTLTIIGKEKLPENGRCFFVANHLYGVLDGMILANLIGNKYGRFMGISNDAFNLIPQLKTMITSVNVYGKSAKSQIIELDKIYKSDLPINHFPAGEVSRKYNGKIQDRQWHKSFVSKALSEKRDIVPILFQGRNSRLFYAVHSIRSFFGIKANIELILLPSEMLKQKNKNIVLTIGKPIPYALLEGEVPHHILAEKIRTHLYQLKDEPEKELTL
jgi:putative hemolysin